MMGLRMPSHILAQLDQGLLEQLGPVHRHAKGNRARDDGAKQVDPRMMLRTRIFSAQKIATISSMRKKKAVAAQRIAINPDTTSCAAKMACSSSSTVTRSKRVQSVASAVAPKERTELKRLGLGACSAGGVAAMAVRAYSSSL